MAKSMHEINLLPSSTNTLISQLLNWTITIGRLLIILVETLALGTFLYRFSLDMQIQDLNDKIKNQRLIVTSYKSSEDKFRDFQTKLDFIKKIDASGEDISNILNDTIEMGKGYITFRNISISPGVIQIEAQASTVEPLRMFVNALKKYPSVETVSINKVENKMSNIAVIISVNANLKQRDKLTVFEEK